MAKKNQKCKNCQYGREWGTLDYGVQGSGDLWCSNSKSGAFRTGVDNEDMCTQFQQRGKEAPDYMIRLNKLFGAKK